MAEPLPSARSSKESSPGDHRTRGIENALRRLCGKDKVPEDLDQTGRQRIGKYEIIRLLSCSGQAVVLLAFDSELDRKVVLKLYPPASDVQDQARMINEGRTLASIDSPHVAKCLGTERVAGQVFLVIEYIPGEPLSEVLGRKQLSLQQSLEIAIGVASGIAEVHRRDRLHGDLKPGNVMLDRDGVPKLIDFGLAQSTGNDLAAAMGGTAAYMPPEMARSDFERIGVSSDLFGFGAILFHLLFGAPPFAADSTAESLELAKRGEISTDHCRGGVPSELMALMERCLSVNPEDRPGSAEAVLRRLRSIRDEQSSRRRRSVTLLMGSVAIMGFAFLGSAFKSHGQRSGIEATREDIGSIPSGKPIIRLTQTRVSADGVQSDHVVPNHRQVECRDQDVLTLDIATQRKNHLLVLKHPVRRSRPLRREDVKVLYPADADVVPRARTQLTLSLPITLIETREEEVVVVASESPLGVQDGIDHCLGGSSSSTFVGEDPQRQRTQVTGFRYGVIPIDVTPVQLERVREGDFRGAYDLIGTAGEPASNPFYAYRDEMQRARYAECLPDYRLACRHMENALAICRRESMGGLERSTRSLLRELEQRRDSGEASDQILLARRESLRLFLESRMTDGKAASQTALQRCLSNYQSHVDLFGKSTIATATCNMRQLSWMVGHQAAQERIRVARERYHVYKRVDGPRNSLAIDALSWLALLMTQAGDDSGLVLAQQAEQLAQEELSPKNQVRLRASQRLAVVFQHHELLEQAQLQYRETLKLAEQQFPSFRGELLMKLCWCVRSLGRVAEAEALARLAADQSLLVLDEGTRSDLDIANILLASAAMDSGRVQASFDFIDHTIRKCRATSDLEPLVKDLCCATRLLTAHHRVDDQRCRDLIALVDKACRPDISQGYSRINQIAIYGLMSTLMIYRGDVDAGVSWFERSILAAADGSLRVPSFGGRYCDQVRVMHQAGRVDLARQMCERALVHLHSDQHRPGDQQAHRDSIQTLYDFWLATHQVENAVESTALYDEICRMKSLVSGGPAKRSMRSELMERSRPDDTVWIHYVRMSRRMAKNDARPPYYVAFVIDRQRHPIRVRSVRLGDTTPVDRLLCGKTDDDRIASADKNVPSLATRLRYLLWREVEPVIPKDRDVAICWEGHPLPVPWAEVIEPNRRPSERQQKSRLPKSVTGALRL